MLILIGPGRVFEKVFEMTNAPNGGQHCPTDSKEAHTFSDPPRSKLRQSFNYFVQPLSICALGPLYPHYPAYQLPRLTTYQSPSPYRLPSSQALSVYSRQTGRLSLSSLPLLVYCSSIGSLALSDCYPSWVIRSDQSVSLLSYLV